MKRYEGLFILDLAGREESLNEVTDRISEQISEAGGKVETVQKMERRPFARVADKKITAGQYVNFIFEIDPAGLDQLRSRFAMDDDVFRAMFTNARRHVEKIEGTEEIAPV